MTWAAWRAQRPQLVAVVGTTLAFGIWLLATGIAMGHNATWKYWTEGDIFALYALPGVLGLAIGAPTVAAEIEKGTRRFTSTQSVTRERWLWGKLIVGAAVTVVATALFTALLEWWSGAISLSPLTNSGGFDGSHIQPTGFDISGLVFVACGVFAYAVGVCLGAVIRRSGWAFAAGVPIFALARLAVQDWVRPSLVSPKTVALSAGSMPKLNQGVWLLHIGFLPMSRTRPLPGHDWSDSPTPLLRSCIDASNAATETAARAQSARCEAFAHVHLVQQLQPTNHYWALQGAESAIFLGVAAVVIGAMFLGHRRPWA